MLICCIRVLRNGTCPSSSYSKAIIAKKPAAILIAPNDKVHEIEPLRKAYEAGIQVVCVDTFIGSGIFQTGAGDADFPISYVASDNVLGGRMAARASAKAIGEKGKDMSLTSSLAFPLPTNVKKASKLKSPSEKTLKFWKPSSMMTMPTRLPRSFKLCWAASQSGWRVRCQPVLSRWCRKRYQAGRRCRQSENGWFRCA